MGAIITEANFKAKTAMNENVDWSLVEPYIVVAQEIGLRPILGENLFDKILEDFEASTLSGAYLTLYNKYIIQYIAFRGLVHVLPNLYIKMAKGNLFKMEGSERSAAIDQSDLNMFIQRNRETSDNYAELMITYICANSQNYPEYFTNTNGKVYPDTSNRMNRGLSLNMW